MKLKVTFVMLCALLSTKITYSQFAYQDAVDIRNTLTIVVSPTDVTFKSSKVEQEALANYFRNYIEPERITVSQVFAKYDENPFIGPILESSGLSGGAASTTFLSNVVSRAASSAGNVDVTNLADGFAKFLVSRTKEELNVAFFERFYNELKKPEYENARLLFPQTYASLTVIGGNIYNFQAYITGLRESFEKDLNGILANLPKVIASNDTFFDSHKDLRSISLSSIFLAEALLDKQHPGKIIANFDTDILNGLETNSGTHANNVKAAVQTLKLFSESFRSHGDKPYWVSPDDLKVMTDDPVTLRIYLGLVYQKASQEQITFSTGALTAILKTLATPTETSDVDNVKKYLRELVKSASKLSNAIRNISGKERDKLSFTDYFEFYTAALDLFAYSDQASLLPGLSSLSSDAGLEKYLKLCRTGGQIALDINRRNYGSAVLNLGTFHTTGFAGSDNQAKMENFILKYGSFMAGISQAQNSDDVEKAIEAAAMPAGSSRIKRESIFNVSINAYTGFFLGGEKIQDIDNKTKINAYGVTAPVGIAISGGHRFLFWKTSQKVENENKNAWSTSLFFSLIDLGAVAAYRFRDDTTAQIPTIYLKNILSPGAFISIGIPKSPISVNFGAQIGPNLRKVNGNTTDKPSNDYNNKMYTRLSLSVLVDIPVLNLYTKTR
ncbi:hypothetical protein [Dyadobacter bucti]|uniref:hypothetical protein n=1 Tax=Dyadobacter bucti TaxID=2572203 RepID=UPI003F6F71E0